MAKINDFIAFKAAIELLQENDNQSVIDDVYKKSIAQKGLADVEIVNHVKDIYSLFSDQQISDKIAQMLKTKEIKSDIDVVYQTVDNLHIGCPDNPGDWYFTGNFPVKPLIPKRSVARFLFLIESHISLLSSLM